MSLLMLVGCGQKSQTKNDEAAEHTHVEEEILLSEEQMKAVNIRTGQTEQRALSSIVRVNGELTLTPQTKASVNSLMGGVIKQILVYEGEYVKAGQTLAFLENTEIVELQKRYLTSSKEFLIAGQDLKRQQELASQGAGIEKNLQQATSVYEISKAELAGLEKQLQQLSLNPGQVSSGNLVTTIPIKAPISGTIDKIQINIGSYVDIQNQLMSLSDNSQMHCDIHIFEKDIPVVEVGQEVDIVLTNQSDISLKGVIYGINSSFENDAKAIIAHVSIKDKQGLKLFPGMYVTALINTGQQKTDAVPNDAIINREGKKYIFLLKDQTEKEGEKYFCFKSVEVVTGISELGYTQIKPLVPLDKDAEIVVSGAFYLSSMSGEDDDEH
jgi:cobalt-zinc-cadmium efflux system membrane fusion protein